MSEQIPHELEERLRLNNQQHVLQAWGELDDAGRRRLVQQLEAVDFDLIDRLLRQHRERGDGERDRHGVQRAERARPPAHLVRLAKTPEDEAAWKHAESEGEEILKSGRVGVILVAGGQGTRLAFPHPKGMFAFGPVSGCSLFQILAEQLLARSRRAGVSIPYYIMTSDATHDETVAFFAEQQHFGLPGEDVYFFRQGNMPAVDDKNGRLLMADCGSLCLGPDGHGGLLAALTGAGLFDDMRRRGIEHLFYHQVDNPTVAVCDPAFLGFHHLHGSELSTKVVAKVSPEEKMGVVVDVDGQTEIIEYSDLPIKTARKTDAAGNLLLWAGSTAIHVFDCAFLEKLVQEEAGLPFHVAHKQVPHLTESGEHVEPEAPNAFKFERFIFDALPHAQRTLVVEADRAKEFNPVKNASGSDTPESAKAAMCSIFRDWLESAGAAVDDSAPVEISPTFAIDAVELGQKIEPGTRLTGPVYLK